MREKGGGDEVERAMNRVSFNEYISFLFSLLEVFLEPSKEINS